MDLTNFINDGKKDWEKVLSRRLNESDEVRNSGHSTVQSDVSPNAAGGERTVGNTLKQMAATYAAISNNPAYEKMRKEFPSVFDEKKKKYKNVVRKLVVSLAKIVASGQTEFDIGEEVEIEIENLVKDKAVALKKVQEAALAFNSKVDMIKSIINKTPGVHLTHFPVDQKTKAPLLTTPEQFATFLNRHDKLNDHLVDMLLKGYSLGPTAVTKRDTAGSGHGGRNVQSVLDADSSNDRRNVIPLFTKIVGEPVHFKTTMSAIKAVFDAFMEISRIDGSIIGLKEKLNMIQIGKKGRETQAAQRAAGDAPSSYTMNVDEFFVLIDDLEKEESVDVVELYKNSWKKSDHPEVADLIDAHEKGGDTEEIPEPKDDDLVSPDEPQNPDEDTPPDDETRPGKINETAKPGPGKVFSQSTVNVDERTDGDKATARKRGLNESWKNYSEKNKDVKNGEEPEGFSIVLG